MTKEDILEKQRAALGDQHMRLFSGKIYEAMDEYAKQQSIAFMEWFDRVHREALSPAGFPEKYYNQFIEQQQNKDK